MASSSKMKTTLSPSGADCSNISGSSSEDVPLALIPPSKIKKEPLSSPLKNLPTSPSFFHAKFKFSSKVETKPSRLASLNALAKVHVLMERNYKPKISNAQIHNQMLDIKPLIPIPEVPKLKLSQNESFDMDSFTSATKDLDVKPCLINNKSSRTIKQLVPDIHKASCSKSHAAKKQPSPQSLPHQKISNKPKTSKTSMVKLRKASSGSSSSSDSSLAVLKTKLCSSSLLKDASKVKKQQKDLKNIKVTKKEEKAKLMITKKKPVLNSKLPLLKKNSSKTPSKKVILSKGKSTKAPKQESKEKKKALTPAKKAKVSGKSTSNVHDLSRSKRMASINAKAFLAITSDKERKDTDLTLKTKKILKKIKDQATLKRKRISSSEGKKNEAGPSLPKKLKLSSSSKKTLKTKPPKKDSKVKKKKQTATRKVSSNSDCPPTKASPTYCYPHFPSPMHYSPSPIIFHGYDYNAPGIRSPDSYAPPPPPPLGIVDPVSSSLIGSFNSCCRGCPAADPMLRTLHEACVICKHPHHTCHHCTAPCHSCHHYTPPPPYHSPTHTPATGPSASLKVEANDETTFLSERGPYTSLLSPAPPSAVTAASNNPLNLKAEWLNQNLTPQQIAKMVKKYQRKIIKPSKKDGTSSAVSKNLFKNLNSVIPSKCKKLLKINSKVKETTLNNKKGDQASTEVGKKEMKNKLTKAKPSSSMTVNTGKAFEKASNKSIGSLLKDKSSQSELQNYPLESIKRFSCLTKKCSPRPHGWSWAGEPYEKLVYKSNDESPSLKMCYPAIQHLEGDIIYERDSVLLKSGPKKSDVPYVAKITAFWESEEGDMMMSLLWYYRPEHTIDNHHILTHRNKYMEDEIFASKHKDTNGVACIEDKCYVLTFTEYCRYRKDLKRIREGRLPLPSVVPDPDEGYPRKSKLPIVGLVSPESVLFCRQVYDYRQKRLLKNPV